MKLLGTAAYMAASKQTADKLSSMKKAVCIHYLGKECGVQFWESTERKRRRREKAAGLY